MRLEPCVRWARTRALALCCLLGCTSTGVVGTSSAAKTRCDGGSADCPSSMQCLAGQCSQCSADSDCAHEQNGSCSGSECVACGTANDCSADSPLCVRNVCKQCTATSDCTRDKAKPVCDTARNDCVQCVVSGDCVGTTPHCVKNVCQECAEDLDCGHDISCMDGVCRAEPGDHGGAGSGGT